MIPLACMLCWQVVCGQVLQDMPVLLPGASTPTWMGDGSSVTLSVRRCIARRMRQADLECVLKRRVVVANRAEGVGLPVLSPHAEEHQLKAIQRALKTLQMPKGGVDRRGASKVPRVALPCRA